MVWTARVAWIVLPITTGAAFGEMFQTWSRAPQIVSGVLLWAVWFAGLLALFTLRPWGFTILRVAAPSAAVLAVATAWSAPWPTATLAIASGVAALATALSSPIAHACAASTAYGPERRFPLRAPRSLLAGPLPLSVVLIAAGVASGPLLLANGDIIAGVAAVVVGAPLVFVLVRALVSLDHRWIVLVPAGLVVVDPLTFPDPVLLPREHIASLQSTADVSGGYQRTPTDILVGGTGALLLTCREVGTFVRRSGRAIVTLDAERLSVTPLRPATVLEAANSHRIPVGTH